MSKNTKNTSVTDRAPRAKGAKFQARKEANERAAVARLTRLQMEQRAMNDLRKQGVVGDDAKLRRALVEQERAKETVNASSFVLSVLDGPHGERAKAFIGPKGLRGNPCRVAMILRNWLQTQGFGE
jgi:hypothetical protein